MPYKALKQCSICAQPTKENPCPTCKTKRQKEYDNSRVSSQDRGYDHTWHKLRKLKLSQDPLCEVHLQQGQIIAASIIHHIQPIDMHPQLRLVMDNLQSLCNDCHEEIHKKERFGR